MCVHVFGCVADQDLDRFPLALALIDMHPEKQAAFFELLMQAFRALVLEPACKAEADDAACPSGKRGGEERSRECSAGGDHRPRPCQRADIDEHADQSAFGSAIILPRDVSDPCRGELVLELGRLLIGMAELLRDSALAREQA